MKQQTHVPVVREWCVSLGVLTAVSISRQEAEMKLAAYLPMLMSDFPDGAFTQDSLGHVAKACTKGFPTYPELHRALREWWLAHRPAPLQLVVDGSAAAAEQREHERQARESWNDPIAIQCTLDRCQGNPLLIRTLRAAVGRHAPQHLGLVPDLPPVEFRASREMPERPRPRFLSPAQLDEINPLPGGVKRVQGFPT